MIFSCSKAPSSTLGKAFFSSTGQGWAREYFISCGRGQGKPDVGRLAGENRGGKRFGAEGLKDQI